MKNKYTKEILEEAVKNSKNYSDIIRYFGGKARGGKSHTLMKNRIINFNIDTSHFTPYNTQLTGKIHNINTFKKEVLVLNGKGWGTHNIKKKLIIFKLVEEKCSCCGITDWNNKKLSFHLDHINGNNKDNRLENLRMLCPNCHSQTDTYSGKNIKR